MGWTCEESMFEFRRRKKFSLLRSVQRGLEAHIVSYPAGNAGYFRGDKAAGA
jgi:hypothetical protein